MSAQPQNVKSSTEAASQKAAPVAKRPPVRPQRSLREKVLAKATTARSSVSEDLAEQPPKPTTPTETKDPALDRVTSWETADLPPRPIESDDDFSDSSIASEAPKQQGRPSIIRTTYKRRGVEMDQATKLANEQLQRAKDALEAAGNMKKECKIITLECLQTMYETVLALSDSRSRHKFNLEKERTRHAHELVRVERAHSKVMADTIKTLTEEMRQARTDICGNLEETKAIRSWLGYETQEPYSQIKTLARTIQKIELAMKETLAKATRNIEEERPQDLEPLMESHRNLKTSVTSISAQLDGLRKDLDKIKASSEVLMAQTKKLEEHVANPPKDPPRTPQGVARN